MKAINLVEGFGMGRVIFVTACLTLQQSIVSTAADRAKLGNLFREAKYQPSSKFFFSLVNVMSQPTC